MFFKKRSKQASEFDIDEIKAKLKETDFEKGDLTALIIAALVTVIPVMLLIVGIMMGVVWLIFIR